MGAKPSKPIHSQSAVADPPRFPERVNLYYSCSFSTVLVTLGEHKNSPQYVVDLEQSWWGNFTFYNGPTKEHPAIATASYSKSTNSLITLPDLLGTGDGKIQEHLSRTKKFFSSSYEYSVWVTNGEKHHREMFRWRSAKKAEVKEVMDTHFSGYKLVRLDDQGNEGEEIFAVFKDNCVTKGSKGSTFQFVGKGATGELGTLWTLMAILTWLRVWQNHQQAAQNAALAS